MLNYSKCDLYTWGTIILVCIVHIIQRVRSLIKPFLWVLVIHDTPGLSKHMVYQWMLYDTQKNGAYTINKNISVWTFGGFRSHGIRLKRSRLFR